ncbi:MAG: hypothetical protein V4671_00395 [Armatimonadota bacterium]
MWRRSAAIAGYSLAVIAWANYIVALLVMPRTKVIFQVATGFIVLSWFLLRFAAGLFPFGRPMFRCQRQQQNQQNQTKIRFSAGTGLSIALCLPILLLYWFCLPFTAPYGLGALDNNPFDDLRFEQRLWREDATCSDGSNRRGPMVMDFRSRYLRLGLTEAEVVRPLGLARRWTPTEYRNLQNFRQRIYFSDLTDEQAAGSGTVLSYYLGEELNMLWGIDRANLFLFFDQNQRYLGCRIGWN